MSFYTAGAFHCMCLKKKKLDACMNTFRAASHRDDEAVLFKHAFISTNNDNDTCLFIKVYKGFSLHKSVLTSLISAPVPHVARCSPEIFIVGHFIKNHMQPLRQQLLNNSWKSTSVLPHVFKSCTRIRR